MSAAVTTLENNQRRPVWKTYVHGVIQISPAFAAWWISAIYLLPKLEKVWADSGIQSGEEQRVMFFAVSVLQHAPQALFVAVIAMVVLELFLNTWSRCRDAGISAVVFFFNTAIFAGITAMCICALLIMPSRLAK